MVSFRDRLALFFVLIVVVPMLAVTFMLFRLIGETENGRSGAAAAARHDVAQQLFAEQRDRARAAIADVIAGDQVLTSSIAGGDDRRARKRARQLVKFHDIERIVLTRGGRTKLQAGDEEAIAPAVRRIESVTQRGLGRLAVSVIDARSYARRVRRITGLHTVVRDGSTLLETTLPGLRAHDPPRDGKQLEVRGRTYRVMSFDDRAAFTGQNVRVSTLAPTDGTGDRIREGRITAGLILLGFFVIAIACAVLVSKENVALHEAVSRAAITDALTGLPNRRAFDDELAREIERSKRYGSAVGLLYLDIDDFKAINDTYDHQQGDAVLREIARVMREVSREVDHPVRLGGEEFAIIVPGTDVEGSFSFAERVRAAIAACRVPRLDGQGEIGVTSSCGVAAAPPVAADAAALEASADRALHEAKQTGKNRSVRAS